MTTHVNHVVFTVKGALFRELVPKVFRLHVFLGVFVLGGCNSEHHQLFNESLARDSDLVVRVVVEEEFGGSAYHYVKARVIRVFKKPSSASVQKEIGIGYLGAGDGIPVNVPCTVYLKCVPKENECRWYLNESDLNEEKKRVGVSHIERP